MYYSSKGNDHKPGVQYAIYLINTVNVINRLLW